MGNSKFPWLAFLDLGSAHVRQLAAEFFPLNRRTFHVTKGAKDTAVARQWSEQLTAAFAVVIKLTGIGRHFFLFNMAALRAGQCREALHCFAHDVSVKG
jgi:hypothetical protein